MSDVVEVCPQCGEPLFYEALTINGLGFQKCRRQCKCQRELEDKLRREVAAKEKAKRVSRLRKNCFHDSAYQDICFSLDDEQEPKLSRRMRNYANSFATFKEKGQGLLLYGRAGTGKSFYAACIANALIEAEYSVYMTTVSDLIGRMQRETFTNDVLSEVGKYDLLIIDDLGAESNTSFRQEKLFDIVDKRYRNNMPMIVSTNLTADDLSHPKTVNETRVFGRIIERCLPIEVDRICRRNKTANKEEMLKTLDA